MTVQYFSCKPSFAQQRMWLLDQLEPDSALYNITTALKLSGELDVDAMRRALAFLLARHESLRTTFAYEGGQLEQRWTASDEGTDILETTDATEEEIPDAIRYAHGKPFDLSRPPLVRCRLLRLSREEHVLVLTMHHIVSDGESASVFARELAQSYNAFRRGAPPVLRELPIRYADYAEWQRSDAVVRATASQLRYWENQLRGIEPIRLCPDRPRPSRQSFAGDTLYFGLPSATVGKLAALGRVHGSSLFITLLSAWYVLLYRYTGQRDLVVGSPVAGRNQLEIEGLIGLFVNTLVLRARVDPAAPFDHLLHHVRDTVLDAQANQEVGFDQLVQHLQPERDLSHAPLFQTLFAYQEAPSEPWPFDGLTTTRLRMPSETSKFDLTLALERVGDRVEVALEYSVDLFDRETMERMWGHFESLLTEISTDSALPIRDYRMLTERERDHLLSGQGRLLECFSVDQCIHEAFETRVEEAPQGEAVTFEERHVPFLELNRRANQLARYVHGLMHTPEPYRAPERLIGICLPRSDELVVAILAVLKAGFAYVPLDPTLAAERIRFYVEDSDVALVITDSEQAALFAGTDAQVLCVDAARTSIGNMQDANLQLDIDPDRLAYVIYTSGSTGKPKGVMVTHRNVTRLMAATDDWFHFGPDDVWTLFHSVSFDFSVWELWGALLYGGRLVVVPWMVSRAPEAFRKLVAEQRVTVLNQTPSAFKQFIDAEVAAREGQATRSHGEERREGLTNDLQSRALCLRWVIFGGETLDPASLQTWTDTYGDTWPRLINMYGITETTVHVTFRPITRADVANAGVSPIGIPIPDLRLYVLDENLQPVPIGVIGEIFVGGAGVARGYLNRPELTRERFITFDPTLQACDGVAGPNVNNAAGASAGRVYRTGDLARWLPDGSLDYRGRADDQVKIRGFRIELGEIEVALRERAGMREAVVTAHRDERTGETRLVAHVVSADGQAKVEHVRARLKETLPDYMLPAQFVFLQAMPLTSNGKIDRKALVAASRERPNLASEYAEPTNDAERILVSIWQKVLGIDKVGILDNFFALGGDSLRGVQAVARAREQGLDVDLVQLFEHQTIVELAAAMRAQPSAESTIEGNPAPWSHMQSRPFELIAAEDRAKLPATAVDAYPLSGMQGGMLYHMALSPESNVYHCTGTAHLRLNHPFDENAFREAIDKTVERHDVLRTSFDLTQYSQPLQIVHREAVLPLVVRDVRHLDNDAQEAGIRELLESEKRSPFDLSRPTLLRIFIHVRSDNTIEFTMTECHPIFDGWSYHSMIVEIFNRYAALRGEGSFVEPAPLAVRYRDFVALERQAVSDPRQHEFWQRRLTDCTVLRLPRVQGKPIATERPPVLKRLTIALPDSVYAGLRRLMREASVPLKSVLLAGHIKAMSLASGEVDIMTGLSTNGRPEVTGGDQMFGLFLNTLPFRFEMRPGSWLTLVQNVFDAECACLPYRRLPLAEIQRQFGKEQLLDEALFNFMDFHVYENLSRALGFHVLEAPRRDDVSEGTNFALTVHVQHLTLTSKLKRNQISIQLDYDEERLTRPQIEELAGYYQRVFAAMARQPNGRHDRQCFLASDMRRSVLERFSRLWSEDGAKRPAVYVLDAFGQPCPTNTPGELCVGGDRLESSPELPVVGGKWSLDPARWVDSPARRGRGERVYRTGYRARFLAHGSIEVLGRLDERRTLRGLRVEPAEADTRLHNRLRLRETLGLARVYEPPVSEIERGLALIWAQVLKLDRVGRYDHFFDLGGHSLLAVRIVSRARQAFGVEIGVADLLAQPVLVDLALRIQGAARHALPPIKAVARASALPLSFSQQRLWFLSQMQAANQAYNTSLGFRMVGELDRPALRRALGRIVARHEALRTTFVVVAGEPRQRVGAEDCGFDLLERDLCGHSAADAELQRVMAEEALAPFDLGAGPLIRGQLVRLGDREHVLLITQHHIVCDGWSLGIFLQELSALYSAFHRGESDPLEALPVQYADYAVWERQWLTGEVLDRQSEYWRRALADAPERLELPTDRPRPPEQDFSGACLRVELDETLTAGLKAMSLRHGTTLFMTMLAGWAVVLARLSGQWDVVVGSPIANRMQAEVEPLIGYFSNTLALRLDLSGNPLFSELLQRVKSQALAAQQNQELPFEQVVEIVKPPRRLAHSPVFQVMFAWQASGAPEFTLPGLTLTPTGAPYERAKFDLSLTLAEREGRIRGDLEYATALFERNTIERHLTLLRRVLTAMVDGDQTRIEDVELLSPVERRQVLVDWNATATTDSCDRCIHEVFEEQVRRAPEAIAVIDGDKSQSYLELNTQANRLANELRARGTNPGDPVAILLERSLELVVAELAVLKCGAVYVPLEWNAPVDRTAFLLEDCNARIVLTSKAAELPETTSTERLNWDELGRCEGPAENRPTPVTSADAAYIMYTSGSTGKPKGVVVRHRGVVRLVVNCGYASLQSDDRVGFIANPAFDAATFDVWAPLLNGAAIVIIDQSTLLTVDRFKQELRARTVTTLLMTTGLFHQYHQALSDVLSQLRYLVVGGDVLDPAVARSVLQSGAPAHMINAYGPTEVATIATTHEIVAVGPTARDVPIGRPIGNTRIYILDRQGQPVPIGVPGEIHIGGIGVALGYLNRPELTAERFLPDPFAEVPHAKMFRTGDLGRYRENGIIEYLGRNDNQLKIRGYRVELEEIEASLKRHPRIRDAVVVARYDDRGQKRLIAYYSPAQASQNELSVDVAELRSYLSATLPAYMVPAMYVKLDTLPLTVSGKVDRRRLPEPDRASIQPASGMAIPCNALEKELQDIWSQVLGAPNLGIYDNFFDVGGHSLLLARVHHELQHRGYNTVSIVDLFRYPTIHALARRLQGEQGRDARQASRELEKQVQEGRLRLERLQRTRQNA